MKYPNSLRGSPATIDDLDITKITGLSEQEAAERLKAEGYNELPSSKQRSILAIAFDVMHEPIFLFLIVGGAVYLVLGDFQEALMLLTFVIVVIGITLYQERKTERALEALRDLSSPRALVIRDGKQERIAGREVVRGDIVFLAEGDRVPADGMVLACINLSVDESLLTGEPVPVRKTSARDMTEIVRPGGDDLPFIYSGTLVVHGHGIAEVYATGINTELGKIGEALHKMEPEDSALQRETRRWVGSLARIGLVLCVLVVVLYGLTRGDWLQAFLAGIALAMAILPEEFPVVLTVFLALGAWRISQKRVLTRRVPAIETLGSATVLCVDKTGTLTLNKMTVKKIFVEGKFYDINYQTQKTLPDPLHEIVEFSILASQRDPFDPMEKAFKELGEHYLLRTEHLHNDWTLVREYPLSPKLLAMSHVWKAPVGENFVIAAKGAPEAIADLCHFDEGRMEQLSHHVSIMAHEGLRVLGVAKAYFSPTELPGTQHEFKFQWIGLAGLANPVRPGVPAAIEECYAAGVRVIMITGDYPGTAQSIARQIGLRPMSQYITGSELDQMDDLELQHRIRAINIFARVVPEQKLRLVNALKANNEVVAMTGDGVNDATALKAANIGIAMGGRGTDVARESAALVLLDDDFASIVEAIKLGRRIFDNLKKAMAFILAVHMPIVGLSLIPVLFAWPLILLPAHIALLQLIIDPACSIVFEAEPEESDVMNRPPRDPQAPLLGRRTVSLSLLQGMVVFIVTLATYAITLNRGQGEFEARALVFTTLVIADIGLILANRSWSSSFLQTLRSPNVALWWIVGGAIVFLALVLYVPFLRELFRFNFLHPIDLAICLLAGAISVAWFEVLKLFGARHSHSIA